MTHSRMSLALLLLLLVVALTVCAAPATEQNDYSNPNMTPTNNLPNPFSERQLMALPDGRTWGSTAGVDAAPRAATTFGPLTDAGAMAAWTPPASIPSCTTTQTGT